MPSGTGDFLRALPDALAKFSLGVDVEYVREIDAAAGFATRAVEIAGCMDRGSRKILIASSFKREQQRFTLAHEVGHWVLHTGVVYHRDRPISDSAIGIRRPVIEFEADLFAAELLMPRKYLRTCFISRFRSESAFTDDDGALQVLADAINSRSGLDVGPVKATRRTSSERLRCATPFERARAVAQVSVFDSTWFESLAAHFDVSPTAMAIQLLDIGLVA